MLKRYNDIGFERSVRKRLTQIRSVLEKKPVFGAEIAKLVIMFMITANLYQVWCGDASLTDIFRYVDNSSKWYKFFHFKIGQLSKVNTLSQQTKLKNLK